MKTQRSSPLVTYSNWIQWGIVVVIGGLVAFFYLSMDVRYATKDEVLEKEAQLQEIRLQDLENLTDNINTAVDKADANNLLINRIDVKMSRIEAQNEMIMKAVDNLTYTYRGNDK